MMSAAFLASCTGIGMLVGAALAACSRRLLATARSCPLAGELAATLLTAAAFGGLACRFGHHFDLLPYSVLAAVGVALGLIDLVEQRLPSELVYSAAAVLGALFATAAIVDSRSPDLLRALAGMVILAGFYLVLALGSRGGLGAGDLLTELPADGHGSHRGHYP